MHPPAATPGASDGGTEPAGLGQAPAEVVLLPSADTGLAAVSEARTRLAAPPPLRLASPGHLRHPMSVDLHVGNCASRARLAVARVLGGPGCWRYGARLAGAGVSRAPLPGDDKPDPELRALCTASDRDCDALWPCPVEGGPENSANFLGYARWMLSAPPGARDARQRPARSRPVLRAGPYWPGAGQSDLDTVRLAWSRGAPVVPVVFHRALVQGAGPDPIDRLTGSLSRHGEAPGGAGPPGALRPVRPAVRGRPVTSAATAPGAPCRRRPPSGGCRRARPATCP